MTSKERVLRTLHFQKPDRVPRDLWTLPGAWIHQKENLEKLCGQFERDFAGPPVSPPRLPHMKGERTETGICVDEWNCEFHNLQPGIVGEVKNPLVKNWSDLDKVKPPYAWVGAGMEKVNEFCNASGCFTLSPTVGIFERMQYIRGSENLYVDLGEKPAELYELRDIIHKFNLAYLEPWLKSSVDAITLMDDWGSQWSLLIRPEQWREFFKPCYAQYTKMAHDAGKHVFMHSDGYIVDIYEDLIEIGVNAVNSQLFCMPIEDLGKKFKGRITFWGEMDRQNLLPFGAESQIRQAVRRIYNNLSANGGGVIAQFEYGLETKFQNAQATFDEWNKVFS